MLWLNLFNAEAEEDLDQISNKGEATMDEEVKAIRKMSAADEFYELQRQRDKADIDAARLLSAAEREGKMKGEKLAEEKWRKIIEETNVENEKQAAQISELAAELARLRAELESRGK